MKIGMVLFGGFTQLDLTGPFEVFARFPNTQVLLLAQDAQPVRSDRGLAIVPTHTFSESPALDILFVPGGPGVNQALINQELLEFISAKGLEAQYITSVCTGALVLAAAGLLDGYQATTHWMSIDLLRMFGVKVIEQRVVQDRNRLTGGGVTAGIDFALHLAAVLHGVDFAKSLQLWLEYNPQPPFEGGHPSVAEAEIVEAALAMSAKTQEERKRLIASIVSSIP